MEQREQVVITVEALRCYRCRAVMDPVRNAFNMKC